jgi:hypothetical protein
MKEDTMASKIEQPDDLGDVWRLNDRATAMKKTRMGHTEFNRRQHEIDHVVIGKRRFWTDEAINRWFRKRTVKGQRPAEGQYPEMSPERGPGRPRKQPTADAAQP